VTEQEEYEVYLVRQAMYDYKQYVRVYDKMVEEIRKEDSKGVKLEHKVSVAEIALKHVMGGCSCND
jgi:hypothetical protein